LQISLQNVRFQHLHTTQLGLTRLDYGFDLFRSVRVKM